MGGFVGVARFLLFSRLSRTRHVSLTSVSPLWCSSRNSVDEALAQRRALGTTKVEGVVVGISHGTFVAATKSFLLSVSLFSHFTFSSISTAALIENGANSEAPKTYEHTRRRPVLLNKDVRRPLTAWSHVAGSGSTKRGA